MVFFATTLTIVIYMYLIFTYHWLACSKSRMLVLLNY
jgi:hypothetical protein